MKFNLYIPLSVTALVIVIIGFIQIKREKNPQYPFNEIKPCVNGNVYMSDKGKTLKFHDNDQVEVEKAVVQYQQRGNRIITADNILFYQECDSNRVKDSQGTYYYSTN